MVERRWMRVIPDGVGIEVPHQYAWGIRKSAAVQVDSSHDTLDIRILRIDFRPDSKDRESACGTRNPYGDHKLGHVVQYRQSSQRVPWRPENQDSLLRIV